MLLSPLLALFYAISFDISLQYLRSISSIVLTITVTIAVEQLVGFKISQIV